MSFWSIYATITVVEAILIGLTFLILKGNETAAGGDDLVSFLALFVGIFVWPLFTVIAIYKGFVAIFG